MIQNCYICDNLFNVVGIYICVDFYICDLIVSHQDGRFEISRQHVKRLRAYVNPRNMMETIMAVVMHTLLG